MANQISRSTVNEQQYAAPEFQKSGFPLSYRRYMSHILGRIQVGGFHWVMPGDKISGKTSGKATFKRLVTPIVSPVNAMQYNVYLPLRPLDRSFMKGMTPTKLNSMSANWSMPTVTTRYLVDQITRALFNVSYNSAVEIPDSITASTAPISKFLYLIISALQDGTDTLENFVRTSTSVDSVSSFLYGTLPSSYQDGIVNRVVSDLILDGSIISTMADKLYLRDALIDISNSITAKLGSIDNPISGSTTLQDFVNLMLSAFYTPFIGRYSYYADFKYEFLRPFDFYRISRALANVLDVQTYQDFLNIFSDTPQNEYALRAMYAVWYELFRNVDLEPVSDTLPDWREWSSTSIFNMSAGGNLLYLIYRPRPWEDDMFVSAQIDDLSRHVYAPITRSVSTANQPNAAGTATITQHTQAMNNLDAQAYNSENNLVVGTAKPTAYNLPYVDQLTGQQKNVVCPVPANINDVLSSLDTTFMQVYGLDLNSLRQSQMLERYLKRNYLFGDEYQDRMLAHYQSRVSDMRINKPEILSRSLDGYDMGQQVSNVSTDETKVGDRTATAEVNVNGEQFTTFAEEFGILISIVCMMPRGMYDGTCPQNYLSKQVDMPLPEFAANNEEFGRKTEIAGSGLSTGYAGADQDNRYIFGRYPAYHAWRSRVDEVSGEFLDELQDCTFRRFFGMFSDDTTPKLNYFFIHCRPNLNMFADNVLYDTQLYSDLVHECYVERVLPTPVEVI